MVQAYVLLKVEAGRVHEAADILRGTEGIKSVEPITGPNDLIAEVEAQSARRLAELVFNSMQELDSVRETDTRIILDK